MRVRDTVPAWVSSRVGGGSLSLIPVALTDPHSISMLGGLPILSTVKIIITIKMQFRPKQIWNCTLSFKT